MSTEIAQARYTARSACPRSGRPGEVSQGRGGRRLDRDGPLLAPASRSETGGPSRGGAGRGSGAGRGARAVGRPTRRRPPRDPRKRRSLRPPNEARARDHAVDRLLRSRSATKRARCRGPGGLDGSVSGWPTCSRATCQGATRRSSTISGRPWALSPRAERAGSEPFRSVGPAPVRDGFARSSRSQLESPVRALGRGAPHARSPVPTRRTGLLDRPVRRGFSARRARGDRSFARGLARAGAILRSPVVSTMVGAAKLSVPSDDVRSGFLAAAADAHRLAIEGRNPAGAGSFAPSAPASRPSTRGSALAADLSGAPMHQARLAGARPKNAPERRARRGRHRLGRTLVTQRMTAMVDSRPEAAAEVAKPLRPRLLRSRLLFDRATAAPGPGGSLPGGVVLLAARAGRIALHGPGTAELARRRRPRLDGPSASGGRRRDHAGQAVGPPPAGARPAARGRPATCQIGADRPDPPRHRRGLPLLRPRRDRIAPREPARRSSPRGRPHGRVGGCDPGTRRIQLRP